MKSAWSVQFQSHLTILVLMEDPQLTDIKSAGQITCAQVEKHLGYKRSSHCASALI